MGSTTMMVSPCVPVQLSIVSSHDPLFGPRPPPPLAPLFSDDARASPQGYAFVLILKFCGFDFWGIILFFLSSLSLSMFSLSLFLVSWTSSWFSNKEDIHKRMAKLRFPCSIAFIHSLPPLVFSLMAGSRCSCQTLIPYSVRTRTPAAQSLASCSSKKLFIGQLGHSYRLGIASRLFPGPVPCAHCSIRRIATQRLGRPYAVLRRPSLQVAGMITIASLY